jgi:membrane protein YqaA with SNARE-associated domain
MKARTPIVTVPLIRRQAKGKSESPLSVPVLAAAMAIGMFLILQLYPPIDVELVRKIGYPALIIAGVVSGLTFFLPIPVLPLVFAVSGVADPVMAAAVAASSMTAGMMGTYLIGRHRASLPRKFLQDGNGFAAVWARRAERWLEGPTIISSFLLALVPNPIYDFAGVIAGSVKVPCLKFLFGTFAGKVAQTAVVAALGYFASGYITF